MGEQGAVRHSELCPVVAGSRALSPDALVIEAALTTAANISRCSSDISTAAIDQIRPVIERFARWAAH
jgi:hypothetical protein